MDQLTRGYHELYDASLELLKVLVLVGTELTGFCVEAGVLAWEDESETLNLIIILVIGVVSEDLQIYRNWESFLLLLSLRCVVLLVS